MQHRDCSYSISLLESLQCLLLLVNSYVQLILIYNERSPIVYHILVLNFHSLPGGNVGIFCDASSYQTSPLFETDPCALQIQLYYEEPEDCNHIGTKPN